MKELYDKLLDKTIRCSCGREHFVPIKRILIANNAVGEILNILNELGLRNNFYIVSDLNTDRIAGQKVGNILTKAGFKYSATVFQDDFLIADMEKIDRIISEIKFDISAIIAVGSGTINDICRYVSFKMNIPYIIVATAPSMDGFASPVSPLVINGFKKTFNAVPPIAIIGDLDILKDAPYNMIAAGFGDIIGKHTSLADWKLGKILSDEFFCEDIESIVRNALNICTENIKGLKKREPAAIENLMHALILSGIAMLMLGNSRPASGAEHHVSHFWEMHFLMEKIFPQPLHGEKVGIAEVIVAGFYNRLSKMDKKEAEELFGSVKVLSKDELYAEIKKAYGAISDEIIKDNFTSDPFDINVKRILEEWENIKNAALKVPDSSVIKKLLDDLGAVSLPKDLGISRDLEKSALENCMFIRKTITVLRIYDSLGILRR